MKRYDYDVAIIGGGPAGSAAACYLARKGVRTAVFERESFPREHVGESLVPSTTRVLKDLNFLPKMETAGFVKKYGAVWTATPKSPIYSMDWHGMSSDVHADIRFGERQQEGVDRNYTYHVDRGKFDQLLLEHAREHGAAAFEETRVDDVRFLDDGVELRVTGAGVAQKVISAKMVVDASGRKTVLGSKLQLKEVDPVFRQFALHTWFDACDRSKLARREEHADFIIIHFLAKTNTWMWQIPISETVTSIGVVTHKGNFDKNRSSQESFFWDCVSTRPDLYEGLKSGRQMRPLKVEGDYSYAMSKFCGDRWVLIGDAARFVDPIFSSGVGIALNSARLASHDILRAIEANDFSAQRFEPYQRTARAGARNWYEFISLYYRLNVLFTAFVQDPRYRLDVLALLQGDLYSEERPEVLNKMRKIVEEVSANSRHPWHSHLGDLQAPISEPTATLST